MADNQPTTNLPGEEWKPVAGWEGIYSVSNMGRIKSHARRVERGIRPMNLKDRIMKPGKERHGHEFVYLQLDKHKERKRIHRLVIETFEGPIPEGMHVCHNDGNPANNKLSNLRVDTASGNAYDKNIHGTDHNRNKTHCPKGHELNFPNLVEFNAKRGHRNCLACNRARAYLINHPELRRNLDEISDSYYERIMKDAA